MSETQYTLPPHGKWVLLKIVEVENLEESRLFVEENEVIEEVLPHVSLKLVHASSTYGERPYPYRVRIPEKDIVLAFPTPRDGKLGWLSNYAHALRAATDLTPDQSFTVENLLGKNVMGMAYRTPNEYHSSTGVEIKEYDNILPYLAHSDGIAVKVTRADGKTISTRATWESLDNITCHGQSGNLLTVTPDGSDKQLTVARIDDQWRDINEG